VAIRRERPLPQPAPHEVDELRRRLDNTSVSIGIPAFNEREGIVQTLDSVYESLSALGVPEAPIILSDSSDSTATVDAASEWARSKSAQLVIDRSDRRRTSKEARNVILDLATSDILIQADADVVVPPPSLLHLLRCLTAVPRPAVAVGATAPDPEFGGAARRASAWQLRATRRYASSLPEDAVRSEAAFWGGWRSFYRTFRFPIGSESVADDVCLAQYVIDHGLPARNCWQAVVEKVPAGTLHDFFLQTHRFYTAAGDRHRSFGELKAAAVEAAHDPLGAALYLHARLWSAREKRRSTKGLDEMWEVSRSTKR
jgi:glycosyltransferase involved in cell wall biosynthesis